MHHEVKVATARKIAEECDKDVVVILAWNGTSGLMHTTTYGRSASNKIQAAALGDVVSKAAGCDLSQATTYEDFRAMPIAQATELLNRARKLIEDGKTIGIPPNDAKQWLEDHEQVARSMFMEAGHVSN